MTARKERRLASVTALPSQAQQESEPLLVHQYLDNWLWGKQSLRASTHESYETHIHRYFDPFLGHLALADLRPEHIEHMLRTLATVEDRRGRPLSVSSLRRVHATLMSALNAAVRRGLIDRNPAVTVELPRAARSRVQTWSSDDLAKFLDATRDERLHILFLLLALLGLRRGEALGLRWEDVDLNAGTVRVERSLVRLAEGSVVGPPKSASGARTLAIDDETARKLHWHQCRQRLEVMRATGVVATPELVFTSETGEALDPRYVSRHFDRLVARQGLARIRLHDLRHTSASIGLAAGESLVEVSRRLGHSSIVVTADIYSHISPVVAKESAERLARSVYNHTRDNKEGQCT